MIEFDPVVVDGEVLRRHWLVVFTRAGRLYSFADSRRPGHIAGPFRSLEALVAEYEAYRGRKIVSTQVMDDFKRRARQRRMRETKVAPAG
jgi:hypothetical protein